MAFDKFLFLGTGTIGQMAKIGTQDLGLLLVLASIFTAYPMLESVKLMQYISPFTLILTVNLEPIYGIILAYFVFGESEKMSPIFYTASSVMILAIIANGILKSKKRSKEVLH